MENYVEGGTFTMGATAEQGSEAYSDEKPAHRYDDLGFRLALSEL